MKKDIILCGVGGQGILSIATIIGQAATRAGLELKQAEVHGMSQRGGDVQSNLRLSTQAIHSDLIPTGQADLIISMEPMECLRYVSFLSEGARIVTSSRPLVNIPNYPDAQALHEELESLGIVHMADIEEIARRDFTVKSANMILLGMAAPFIGILRTEDLREAISVIFQGKGEAVVEANLKAFDAGLKLVEE